MSVSVGGVLYFAVLVVLGGVLLAEVYVLLGLPRLWGKQRGVPFCGHPFEQTWGRDVRRWTCPRCLTRFVVDEVLHRWVPER